MDIIEPYFNFNLYFFVAQKKHLRGDAFALWYEIFYIFTEVSRDIIPSMA